jgi:RIO kinase 1
MGHEYQTLDTLFRSGADVPRPIANAPSALLMEYYGDERAAAPQLAQIDLTQEEARTIYRRLIENIEIWLGCHIIHGDLSEFNILYWRGGARIIDFPQAVDPRTNRNACALLERDLDNVTRYFSHYGVAADPIRTARSMWDRYTRAKNLAAQ